ncbi:MAG: FAD-binding oxidoreductase [Pelagimonas sp.]|jgi:FAD/FMN-containing dehydrogenase|nr:FAD-binding oxidoreductase [Pelagimonas sp.]
MTQVLEALRAALGADQVLTGADMAAWSRDWTGQYDWTPLCVLRPRDRDEVSAVMKLAYEHGAPVVPVGGNTGISGGTVGEGAIMLSLERMTRIREIRSAGRIAVVEAGVILSQLHDATEAQGLRFPMTFGAKGSCRIGGILSTNAGGSNVLRYGNTRDLVLGVEIVLPDGRVVDAMSALHKNNSGLDLRHLVIGAEGTLGVITAAVLKLVPQPRVRATAMVAMADLDSALQLLNRMQDATGGAVEACEYMPARYMRAYEALHPDIRPVFDRSHEVNILIELASTAPRDAAPGPDGQPLLAGLLQDALGEMLAEGLVQDAVIAQSDAQRAQIWARREAAAEVATSRPVVMTDVAVPVDQVARFVAQADARLATLDPQAGSTLVAHLGDGNVHYSIWPGPDAPPPDDIMFAIEEEALALGGTFSAEHGIGVSKRPAMLRFKDPQAVQMMRQIKQAIDPKGILNPGKSF